VLSKPGLVPGEAPVITTQPQNRSVKVGQSATFTVEATGTAPLTYEWRKNGVAISNTNSASYTVSSASLSDNGAKYSVKITNGYGSVTSQEATLTVTEEVAVVNVLNNPGFESGTTGWTFYSNASGGFTTVTPGYEGNNAGRVTINTLGSNMQLFQSGISLDANTEYELSFYAYSTQSSDLRISVQKHGSPYTNYGLNLYTFNLTNGWNLYSVKFTTKGFASKISDARLMLWFVNNAKAGEQYFFDKVVLTKSTISPKEVVEDLSNTERILPENFALFQNYPNPFNPSTTINYSIPESGYVTLKIYDLLGKEIITLADGYQESGFYTKTFNASSLSSGIYFYRLIVESNNGSEPFISTKKMELLK